MIEEKKVSVLKKGFFILIATLTMFAFNAESAHSVVSLPQKNGAELAEEQSLLSMKSDGRVGQEQIDFKDMDQKNMMRRGNEGMRHGGRMFGGMMLGIMIVCIVFFGVVVIAAL